MRRILVLCTAAALALTGCVKVDSNLGEGLVDKSLLFDTYIAEFPLEEIQMRMAEDLSGYSSTRVTLGAIRDDVFGLTTRESAFSLIPVLDTLDLGTDPKAVSLQLYLALDTLSCADASQQRILQNVYVTELTEQLPTDDVRTTREIAHGTELVTDGLPVINGTDGLFITFKPSFAQKYVDAIQQLGPVLKDRSDEDGEDDYERFLAMMPGIHLRTDEPKGNGGRINLFELSCLSVSNNYYYRNNNLAALTVHSSWNGVEKDSLFLMVPGEAEFVDEASAIHDNTGFTQYAFNRTGHQTANGMAADGHIYVEGGGGLKPVILASELERKAGEAIRAAGGDPGKAVIIKASIVLPIDLPENGDFSLLDDYPSLLSPTIRAAVKSEEDGKEYVSFAGLTDASVSTENQGDIDRANLQYAPDITYHLQQILSPERDSNGTDIEDYNIWLLIIHSQKVANASGSLYDNEYYQQLLYASYYNSLYGGGYGYGGYGYGSYGYGSYGSYNSNYYSYMMLAQMMAASSQQSYSYTTELDKDRYYKGTLCGPGNGRHPSFRVVYAIPKD